MTDKARPAAEEQAAALERQRAETEAKLAQVRLQAAELELEDLTARVNERRQKDAEREARARAAQATLEQANRDIVAGQKICKHRKGGRNKDGLVRGTDSYYSVIHHMYPWGELVVMCLRCTKEWRMPKAPDPALRKSDPPAWKTAVLAYKTALEEYQEALGWPTDNVPSGTQLFQFTRTDPAAAAAAAELAV